MPIVDCQIQSQTFQAAVDSCADVNVVSRSVIKKLTDASGTTRPLALTTLGGEYKIVDSTTLTVTIRCRDGELVTGTADFAIYDGSFPEGIAALLSNEWIGSGRVSLCTDGDGGIAVTKFVSDGSSPLCLLNVIASADNEDAVLDGRGYDDSVAELPRLRAQALRLDLLRNSSF